MQAPEEVIKARASNEQKRAELHHIEQCMAGDSLVLHYRIALTKQRGISMSSQRDKRGLMTKLWEDRDVNLL